MVEMALLALLGGVFLALNRILISRLGMSVGPFRSSYWNHVGGFAFLLVVMLFLFSPDQPGALVSAPWWAYLGGAIGALFVAISSIVMPKIGTTRSLALIIAGQMIISTLIDYVQGRIESPSLAVLGVVLILCGAMVPRKA